MDTALVYDFETGTPDVDFLASNDKESERAELERCAAVATMAGSEGWREVTKVFLAQLNACKEALIDQEDVDKIRRLQASARAISNMLGYVQHCVDRIHANQTPPSSQP